MSQQYSWPPGLVSVSIPSIGQTGQNVPLYADFIAGLSPTGKLRGVAVDETGHLLLANESIEIGTVDQGLGGASAWLITAASLPLPTGASTSALQTTGNTTLSTLNAKTSGSLVPTAYDEIDLTYVPSGNGSGQVQTATYKLATVTQKTLTMTYDGSNRLSTVVAS